MIAFGLRCKGDIEKKLEWLFDVYDYDDNNVITFWELYYIIWLLYNIKSIDGDAYMKTFEIIDVADNDNDRTLNKEEFINACMSSEEVRSLFAPF